MPFLLRVKNMIGLISSEEKARWRDKWQGKKMEAQYQPLRGFRRGGESRCWVRSKRGDFSLWLEWTKMIEADSSRNVRCTCSESQCWQVACWEQDGLPEATVPIAFSKALWAFNLQSVNMLRGGDT